MRALLFLGLLAVLVCAATATPFQDFAKASSALLNSARADLAIEAPKLAKAEAKASKPAPAQAAPTHKAHHDEPEHAYNTEPYHMKHSKEYKQHGIVTPREGVVFLSIDRITEEDDEVPQPAAVQTASAPAAATAPAHHHNNGNGDVSYTANLALAFAVADPTEEDCVIPDIPEFPPPVPGPSPAPEGACSWAASCYVALHSVKKTSMLEDEGEVTVRGPMQASGYWKAIEGSEVFLDPRYSACAWWGDMPKDVYVDLSASDTVTTYTLFQEVTVDEDGEVTAISDPVFRLNTLEGLEKVSLDALVAAANNGKPFDVKLEGDLTVPPGPIP